jgi:hypothetical protein
LRKPPHPERSLSPLGEGEQSKDATPAIQALSRYVHTL